MQRQILMLRAYIDDSGSNGQSPFYVLAGFVATVPAWELFSNEWQAVLEMPPALEYVKASEAHRLRDQFFRTTPEDRGKRLDLLGEITRKHVIAGAGVAIRQEAYNRIIRGNINRRFDNPYFICFVGIIDLLMQYTSDLGFKDTLDFVFDEQSIDRKVARCLISTKAGRGNIQDGWERWISVQISSSFRFRLRT